MMIGFLHGFHRLLCFAYCFCVRIVILIFNLRFTGFSVRFLDLAELYGALISSLVPLIKFARLCRLFLHITSQFFLFGFEEHRSFILYLGFVGKIGNRLIKIGFGFLHIRDCFLKGFFGNCKSVFVGSNLFGDLLYLLLKRKKLFLSFL